MALIGLDVGGTGVKAVAFTDGGIILSSAYQEYDMIQDHPGWYELEPAQIFEAARGVLKKAAAQCPEEVLGIGVSSFGESFVCLDENDNILSRSIMYLDNRGEEYVREMTDMLDLKQFRLRTGCVPRNLQSVYKMRVLEQYHPGTLAKTKKIHFIADFILSRLGGEHYTDYGLAATTGAFDINQKTWIDDMFRWAGLDPAVLPTPTAAGTCIGKLSPSAAQDLGLKSGIVLISGGHDHVPSSLGSGVYRAGTAMNAIGTVDTFMFITDDGDMMHHYEGTYGFKNHLLPGHYQMMPGGNLTGGVLLKWFRDHIGKYEKNLWAAQGKDFYTEYEKQMPKTPTDLLVLPRFGGYGTTFAERAGILNLTLSTTNEEIYRAFMESETYEMYTPLKHYMDNNKPLTGVTAVNGGANCDTYMQIRADIYNLPVTTVDCPQPGALGDAMLAGIAAGVYADVHQAVADCVKVRRVFTPDAENHAYYMQMYEKYRKVYDFMRQIECRAQS